MMMLKNVGSTDTLLARKDTGREGKGSGGCLHCDSPAMSLVGDDAVCCNSFSSLSDVMRRREREMPGDE